MGLTAKGALVAIVLAVLAVAFIGSQQARGHSWYEPACCSGDDCAPLPIDSIEEQTDGYLLKSTGELIERAKAKHGRDEDYHLCRSKHTGTIYCLYLPARGV